MKVQYCRLNFHVCNNIFQKYFIFAKIFCKIKQNYTKNEHFTQQQSVFGLFARNFNFFNFILITSL